MPYGDRSLSRLLVVGAIAEHLVDSGCKATVVAQFRLGHGDGSGSRSGGAHGSVIDVITPVVAHGRWPSPSGGGNRHTRDGKPRLWPFPTAAMSTPEEEATGRWRNGPRPCSPPIEEGGTTTN